MTNPWFKFYGGEYLSDPKIMSLNANERSCWITLLCMANQSKNGTIEFLTEETLVLQSRVVGECIGVLKKFEEMKMVTLSNGSVTVKNWQQRQASESYDRVLRHRMKRNVTTEENREEESRREESRKEKKKKEIITNKEILKKSFWENPLFKDYKKKYPYREYDIHFEEMCQWYLKNKGRLPQLITAFGKWLSLTPEDQGIKSELNRINAAEETKRKLEELKGTTKISPEQFSKFKQGMANIGKI